MGRTLDEKKTIVAELKQTLSESQLAVVIDYQGLSVAEITDLRNRLRPTGTICKVTKNTFMRLAVQEDENWQPMTEFLSGTSAFLLVKDDVGSAIRAYQEFKKAAKKTEFRGGVMQGQALNEEQVKAIADLPSKEELIAQVAGAINSIASKLAVGINEVPASLGRSINEVPASLGRCIQGIAAKEEGNS
ncbi:MAG: 50S ribosomal protein L10 [Moorea sp. SIO1F2]|uniref:50S ribosomal protein L10 n=1 Tax=unclassified Moorena TaxID=2683338 RepID=UPI0013BA4196|nr:MULTISPECIES: 50S ribosomal protein L10 [unclassified Moorena]NEO90751.1 50S ribosomal protein L10 [Moorena sp. SIO3G5]NEO39346.1 50S ribosomal protein L10 [Moorena sp. SIOASIH]NEP24538.1 50S ribosomal protein L10 [Moorena sp. SIO3I6]NEQ56908.1 50S ribosomal protein L10 [Moorena sp. SIO4A1]NET82369.1 50S ribosomal protein L10 [Moorena sp. SIO1F2]